MTIPSDATLLNMTPAAISKLYRSTYASVRALPESDQWQYGWMLKRLQAAWAVVVESRK